MMKLSDMWHERYSFSLSCDFLMAHKFEQMLKMTIGNFVDVGQSSDVSDYKI